jgi:hypothetical protein
MNQKMEEARRLAELQIRERIELGRRMRFHSSLQMEVYGLQYTQQLTRAFVFSYFDLIGWLGIDERPIAEMIRSTVN